MIYTILVITTSVALSAVCFFAFGWVGSVDRRLKELEGSKELTR